MITSILTSIKKLLNIENETHFDDDVIMHINSAFMTLQQLGVGKDGVQLIIEDDTTNWLDLFDDDENVSAVKIYVHMRVRLVFDPPESAFLTTSLKEQIKEYEWRMNVKAETEETL